MGVIAIFKEARAIAQKKKVERKEACERFAIALAFNRKHANAGMLANGRWMCPVCNEVHRSTEWSFLTGPQYPACCSVEQGHRLYQHHATGR
jgi:hypothetical protein